DGTECMPRSLGGFEPSVRHRRQQVKTSPGDHASTEAVAGGSAHILRTDVIDTPDKFITAYPSLYSGRLTSNVLPEDNCAPGASCACPGRHDLARRSRSVMGSVGVRSVPVGGALRPGNSASSITREIHIVMLVTNIGALRRRLLFCS